MSAAIGYACCPESWVGRYQPPATRALRKTRHLGDETRNTFEAVRAEALFASTLLRPLPLAS